MTETNGGIIGSFKAALTRIGAGPLLWIVRLVLFAGFLLILKKAKGTPDQIDAAILVALGMATLASEYYMGGEAVRAWFDRAVLRLGAVLGVYAIVLGYAVLQWTGSASEMEAAKTGAQQAAFVAQQDISKSEAELTKKNNELLHRITMAPKRTAEQADADIVNAKANRFWGVTNGCTETKGPQTRAFCDAYASAVADKAGATALIVDREEQKQVAAELKAIRDGRANQKTVVTEDRNDLRFLVTYVGVSQQAAQDISAAWKIMIISVLVFVLGILVKAEAYRDMPRKPWGFMAAINGLLFGRKKQDEIIRPTSTDVLPRTPTYSAPRQTGGMLHIGQGPSRLVMTSKAY